MNLVPVLGDNVGNAEAEAALNANEGCIKALDSPDLH